MNKGLIAGLILIAVGVVGLAVLHGSGAGRGCWSSGPGAPQAPVRGAITIEVEAREFAYEPSTIEVKAGRPYSLRLTNKGAFFHCSVPGHRERGMVGTLFVSP